MQCLAQVSTKTIAVRGWKWLPRSESPPVHLSSLNTFCWGFEAPPLVRQVIDLVTYCCSVLTSLADIQTDFTPLALHILNNSFVPFWAAGTDTTGCHCHVRSSWLSQEAVALLPTAGQGSLPTRAGNKRRGSGRLPVFSDGPLVQESCVSPPHLCWGEKKIFLGFGSKRRR